jgi:hypothetical protein
MLQPSSESSDPVIQLIDFYSVGPDVPYGDYYSFPEAQQRMAEADNPEPAPVPPPEKSFRQRLREAAVFADQGARVERKDLILGRGHYGKVSDYMLQTMASAHPATVVFTDTHYQVEVNLQCLAYEEDGDVQVYRVSSPSLEHYHPDPKRFQYLVVYEEDPPSMSLIDIYEP